ncbi:endonuclease MutS2 [Helicobacter sp. MIT 99-5507]|uniref:endonuclease MutS2 n=1 Tax=Helicobacter sp. MIT 99-5507 TaxID=152489 RepID=UPI000E1FAC59|nr:Smr/MutS family protein [Helicobacter sp. MIT 99-5507]RDU57451.1 endonuclease MutS2 [Helicobacter sp. MIT 99-5507]
MLQKDIEGLCNKLDLAEFVNKFSDFFARITPFYIAGDITILKQFIDELEVVQFIPPKQVSNLDSALVHIKKLGILKLDSIFEFIKIIKYFLYLKRINFSHSKHISSWLSNINIPNDIINITKSFDDDGKINNGIYPKLDSLNSNITSLKAEIKKSINKILQKDRILPYLVDKQTHLIDSKECLLLKAGFNKYLDGRILERSNAGYFYVFPATLQSLYDRLDKLYVEIEILIYEIETNISKVFLKNHAFLKYINGEFDKFDSIQARVMFAKAFDYSFILPNNKGDIVLCDFAHPALTNPIFSNIDFSKQILIITGVNAGGKTMLLKSILSAVLLAKYLIPFKINALKSKIANFKNIYAVINDPQNSKNDISTFAGRMIEFKNILSQERLLLGIDEIELGTDANEASALYFSILKYLQNKGAKVVITTHHKQLASMMAKNPNVELISALYDENARIPTYKFLQGCIGKSYAFESAMRYGIPINIINDAKALYGDNLENLNELIEQTSLLQAKLRQKEDRLDKLIKSNENKNNELNELISKQNLELNNKKIELENIYNIALKDLKTAIKTNNTKTMQQTLNRQNELLKSLPKPEINKNIKFEVGNRVQSGKSSGVIANISNDMALVDLDNGRKMKIHISKLRLGAVIKDRKKQNISFNLDALHCLPSLDLHGKRVDEALILLDDYISKCLMAGYDEVIIKHGIGSGVLSKVVKEFLENHKKVKSFSDAPFKNGGFGAKLVRF